MTIEPDTKDWTWVLDRPCPECGFVAAEIASAAIAGLVRETAGEWSDILRGAPAAVRARPAPGVWSPLEYGCHVRDIYRIFGGRVDLMLTHDDPEFASWDQDATAIEDRYAAQEPSAVAASLAPGASALAHVFEGLSDEQWQRGGRRSNGSTFTVLSIARYLLHDIVHHIHDVTGRPATRET